MSLERRISQMRQEVETENSVYTVIANSLKKDASAMHDIFQRNLVNRDGGAFAEPIDDELVDVYELRPADNPTLSLPSNLNFFDGFSYAACHWYPVVRIVGSGIIKPGDEQFMDEHLESLFPDKGINTQTIQDALVADPSGATWLEERAKVEFTEGNLALIGAKKAITGARKMYEALTAAA